MFPVLFEIPVGGGTRFPVRMIGVLVILAFLVGAWVVVRRLSRRDVMTRGEAFDLCFYVLAAGLVGARVLHVLLHFERFRGRFLEVFQIWDGGLVLYGGLAAATPFAFAWLWKRGAPILRVTDALVIGAALALAIGRVGSFLAGQDYGAHVTSGPDAPWWAVRFPGPDDGWRYAYSQVPATHREPAALHPVQLYMTAANLLLAGGLWPASRRLRRPGVVTGLFFVAYPVLRFLTEEFRGDVTADAFGTSLTLGQFLSVPAFLFGALLLRGVRSGAPPTRR